MSTVHMCAETQVLKKGGATQQTCIRHVHNDVSTSSGGLSLEQGHVEGLTFPGLASRACAGAVLTCTARTNRE